MPDPAPASESRPGASRLGKKRLRTRNRLLANAIALFREQGVHETRLADIARASEVAPATLFNHFAGRAELAGAWVRGEIEDAAAEAARVVVADGRGLRPSLRAMCRSLARQNAAEPALRLAAWRETRRPRSAPVAGLSDALAAEQRRGQLRADRRPDALADLLVDAIEGGLVEGLRAAAEKAAEESRGGDPESMLADRMQARIDLVLDGARKRNERVRPAGAPRPVPDQRPASR